VPKGRLPRTVEPRNRLRSYRSESWAKTVSYTQWNQRRDHLHETRKRSWKGANSRILDETTLKQSRRRMTLARALSRTHESPAIQDLLESVTYLDAANHSAERCVGVDIYGRLVFRDVFNEVGDVLRQDTAVDRALREHGMTKGVERVLREDGGGADRVVRAPASFSARGGWRGAKQLTLGVERRVEGHDQGDGR
jgi:hypothetical protein